MADDFGLLLQPVTMERLARLDCVIVAAEGVAFQWQDDALLMLPDVSHLVQEQALIDRVGGSEIVAVERAFGVEMDVASGRHHGFARLEEGPFAADDAHGGIIDRAAEDRVGEIGFAGGQGAGIDHGVAEACVTAP